ncbi:transcriptional regulator, LysR family [Burkholderia thailandensis E264]|uniref:Transcriptional regulator, LysR family n=3 Tax=Burkholderia thailandensis TaxID=57975 RepID=Q2T5F9_BURTA|nr:transcriptional regulator, LysR family [Burkholderia thailandensis E264]
MEGCADRSRDKPEIICHCDINCRPRGWRGRPSAFQDAKNARESARRRASAYNSPVLISTNHIICRPRCPPPACPMARASGRSAAPGRASRQAPHPAGHRSPFIPEAHPMDMLDNMRLFVRVVEAGSFTAVAKEIDATTAQVSRAVSNLEAHVQTRLLHRTTRHLGLTESGQRYFERAKSILAEIDYANAEARNALLRPSGKLRIHAMTGLGQSHVVSSIVRYQEDNPDVSVELTLAQRMPNLVEEGYDVSIVSASHLPDSGYVAQTCGTSCSVLVASREYLARHGTPTTPEDLAKHVCLRLDTPASPGGEWRLERDDGEETVYALPPAPFQANVPDALSVAVRAGRGIGSIALYTALDDIREGRLVRVLPNYRLDTLSVYAVYATRRYLDAKIRTFLDHLRTTLAPALENDLRELNRLNGGAGNALREVA